MSVQSEINRISGAKTDIGAAIAEKGVTVPAGTKIDAMAPLIEAIQTGITLPTLANEGAAADLLSGKQLIDDEGNIVTGSMPSVTQATPSISVNSSGLITASATQEAGKVAAGTKSATHQLTVQAAQTITPGTVNKTIASGRYLTGTQTIKGDANLIAENIKSGVSIFGVAGSLEAGSGGGTGGDGDAFTALVDRTITEASSGKVKEVGANAFAYCYELSTVNFPACESIGNTAFYYCSKLTDVSFPMCKRIGNGTFSTCTKLAEAIFPLCSTVSSTAFYNCKSLMTASFPQCTRINASVFYTCTALASVNFNACVAVDTGAFYGCTSLTTVDFPACTTIYSVAFRNCTKLEEAFFPKLTSIGSSAFQNCAVLSALVLSGSSVCKLTNSVALSSTAIKNGTGYIYVPSSLVASYKAATNWTYFSNQISAIEDSPYA